MSEPIPTTAPDAPEAQVEAPAALDAEPKTFDADYVAKLRHEAALITRGGWLGRHTQLVPHARMQSLQLKQGPLERRLKLASVRTLSTMGPVVPEVRHLSITDATALIGDQMVRCALARRADGSARPPADQGVPGALSSSLSESTTGDSRSSLRME